ncbi:hypothetical protein ACSFA3_06270 [Variovorax sp. RHLX14]|uniref:hypothetical protein n=1 Tax=Variovorax sp. RHLX14 TaxID=1259731 RepID=UPI003F466C3C
MSVFDMNDQIMTGVLKGMGAAANRFEERMRAIRENSDELKRAERFYSHAMSLAKQVDELTDVIMRHHREMIEKETMLKNANERAGTYDRISRDHLRYLELVVKRLNNVEETLQRQSAHSFALDAFRRYALQELKDNPETSQSSLLNEQFRDEFFAKAWDHFMTTKTVKRGIPRLGIDEP